MYFLNFSCGNISPLNRMKREIHILILHIHIYMYTDFYVDIAVCLVADDMVLLVLLF